MPDDRILARAVVDPARHQPELMQDRFIVRDAPEAEAVPTDVVFVGAGPAGLAGAIELARLAAEGAKAGNGPGEIEIAVLEKAEGRGEHNLSGAVVDPRAFRELFPGKPDSEFPFRRPVEREAVYFLRKGGAMRVPTPPTMRNHGNYVASICEIVRWLGEQAEEAGVSVLPGFPVASLLVDGDDVVGVRTTPSGLDREGGEGGAFMPAVDVASRVVVLSEGARGPLSQAYMKWQGVRSPNPQIYSLGVKELWEVKKPLDRIVHTMGWPLLKEGFGGSFAYPLDDNLVALGWSPASTARTPGSTCTGCSSSSSITPCIARPWTAANSSSGAPRRFRRAASIRSRPVATATACASWGTRPGTWTWPR